VAVFFKLLEEILPLVDPLKLLAILVTIPSYGPYIKFEEAIL